MAFRFNFQSEREDNSKIEILTSSNYEAKEVRYEESQQVTRTISRLANKHLAIADAHLLQLTT